MFVDHLSNPAGPVAAGVRVRQYVRRTDLHTACRRIDYPAGPGPTVVGVAIGACVPLPLPIRRLGVDRHEAGAIRRPATHRFSEVL